MRMLPNEFLDRIELQPKTVAPARAPAIGWGVFLAALPLLMVYWALLGLFMTGQTLIAYSKE